MWRQMLMCGRIIRCAVLPVVVALLGWTSISQATSSGGYGGGGGAYGGVAQMHLPHQMINVLDLLTPLHIRVATDGVKHKP